MEMRLPPEKPCVFYITHLDNLFVQGNGTVRAVLGHSLVDVIDLGVSLSTGVVRAAYVSGTLRIAHLVNGVCTLRSIPLSSPFGAGEVTLDSVNYRSALSLASSSLTTVFGAEFTPTGNLIIAIPVTSGTSGAVRAAKIASDATVTSIGNLGNFDSASSSTTMTLVVVSDSHFSFATIVSTTLYLHTVEYKDTAWSFSGRQFTCDDSSAVVAPLCGRVELRWFQETASWLCLFVSSGRTNHVRFGSSFSEPRPIPAGWSMLDAFAWRATAFLVLASADLTSISFWQLGRGEDLILVRQFDVSEGALQASLLFMSIASILPGFKTSIVAAHDSLIAIRLAYVSFGMTDPVYAQLVQANHSALVPLKHDSGGRLLALGGGGTSNLISTGKLF